MTFAATRFDFTHAARRPWQRLAAAARAEFGRYSARDRDSAALRAHLMRRQQRLLPAWLLVHLVLALLLLATVFDSLGATRSGTWLAALLLGSGAVAFDTRRLRPGQSGRSSARAVRRQTADALLLAVLWAWPAALWPELLTAPQLTLLTALVVALLAVGALALAPLPLAALGFVAALEAGALYGLWTVTAASAWPTLVLLPIYGLLLATGTLAAARTVNARLLAEREAVRQTQLVGLLLRDFEGHATDLLWELGPDGCLTHVAPRLARALGARATHLQTMTLPQALALRAPETGDVTGGRHAAALRSALARGRPFRDLELPISSSEGLRWWSLTAKPLLDEAGHHAGWRGVIADVTAERAAHHQLARLAHFDALTGLANRVQLRERLAEALDRNAAEAAAGATPKRSALVCLDVDHFKTINDTLGHAAGDSVLTIVAERLKSCLRWGDLAARLGGDEFALLIDDVGSDDELHAMARRLTRVLNQTCEVGGQQVAVGASLGVAVATVHGSTLDELMANADLALYAAKEAGRARYELFVPRLGDRHRRRMALEAGLRGALGAGQLRLKWQPRIALDGWRVVGAEALLRWNHPELGEVSPDEFISVAEECGLIDTIGTWVLTQACTEAMLLPDSLVASVNVSAAQLRRDDFARTVQAVLAKSGLPAERLELEITESLFIDDASVPLGHLHMLRAIGVRVAMDDFGTGYSSLAYLRRFPFDTLKIDRAFVHELMTRHDARAIVHTIIDLARTLGMHTLAEGVEEPAQLALLEQAGCEAIQGWLVARALPQPELSNLLANWHPVPPRTEVELPTGLTARSARALGARQGADILTA